MESKQPPKLVKPTNKIKQKIGERHSVRGLLSKPNIESAQAVIDEKAEDFIRWSESDIAQLTEQLNSINENDGEIARSSLAAIIESAERLRDRGGTFGYSIVSLIAKSLVNYTNEIKSISPHHSLVISKHIESLSIVFKARIKGDGGITGVELTTSLQKLVAKYPVA